MPAPLIPDELPAAHSGGMHARITLADVTLGNKLVIEIAHRAALL